MSFSFLKKQAGITLIELLATLSLFSIVITLTSTLILQIFNSEDNIRKQISTKQELNILINEIRQQYRDNNLTICYENNQLSIEELQITYTNISEASFQNNGNTFSGANSNTCMEVDTESPLIIKIATSTTKIETTLINQSNQYTKDIQLVHEHDEVEEPGGDSYDVLFTFQCNFEGNPNFTKTRSPTVEFILNPLCGSPSIYTVENNATFSRNLLLNPQVNLNVNNNFYSTENVNSINIEENSNLNVSGNGIFYGNVTLSPNAKLQIDGDATFNDNIILDRKGRVVSEISIGGDVIIHGNITMPQFTMLTIDGNAKLNGNIYLQPQSLIIIKGDAICNGFIDNKSSIQVNPNKINTCS
ncbi:type II secretion system protein [Ornithinibacillus halophilus]|uniref:Prepilin-type N-terminal cleavage/methylation domain-containing protein n=1 Tax=Ornithinibacillus halophilus TaxID=930117 RepID=A0A1M5EI59_9BACI|nr:type II secretion system protein [Ornithinibacillus halophilus]SHF78973.1 hypothetical protein SAMN05216225_100536 [Ornithinibacillus halophilus]